jgi:hypothetical protein
MFQTLAPGQTVTASVNAAKTYNLAGLDEAKVSAIQGFRYATGSDVPASLKDLAVCDTVSSSEVTVTPDQITASSYVNQLSHCLLLSPPAPPRTAVLQYADSNDHSDLHAKRDTSFNSRIKKRSISYSSCIADVAAEDRRVRRHLHGLGRVHSGRLRR